MALLSKQEIITALEELGEMALAEGHTIELIVLGGAAMILLYDARPATHDVDVMIRLPKRAKIVHKWARKLAEIHSWPSDWLNDGAKGFLHGFSQGREVLSARGIRVFTPSPTQLLAMKLSAWRDDVDIGDSRQLLRHLSGSKQVIWQDIEPYLHPGTELKAQYAFDDLWEAIYGEN